MYAQIRTVDYVYVTFEVCIIIYSRCCVCKVHGSVRGVHYYHTFIKNIILNQAGIRTCIGHHAYT